LWAKLGPNDASISPSWLRGEIEKAARAENPNDLHDTLTDFERHVYTVALRRFMSADAHAGRARAAKVGPSPTRAAAAGSLRGMAKRNR